MTKPELSICMTVKNRAAFMAGKLDNLLEQKYDPKRLEICVTDGGDDETPRILQDYAKHFGRVVYAISDRSVLPFEAGPCCVCDVNAQVCYVAGCEKIVRTDAEVRFTNRRSLQLIDQNLDTPQLCIAFPGFKANAEFQWPVDAKRIRRLPNKRASYAFWCSCFRKADFIENGGVHEEFAKGFGCEDSYFHWWWGKNKYILPLPWDHAIIHLWHGETWTDGNKRLHKQFSLPLLSKMKAGNIPPNQGNADWHRQGMIKEVQRWP